MRSISQLMCVRVLSVSSWRRPRESSNPSTDLLVKRLTNQIPHFPRPQRKKESGLKRRLGIYSSVSVFAFWIQKLWCCRWHCLLSRSKPFIITSPGKLWGWQHLISSHLISSSTNYYHDEQHNNSRWISTGGRNEKSHGRGCFFSNMHVFVTGLVIIHKVQRNSTTQS